MKTPAKSAVSELRIERTNGSHPTGKSQSEQVLRTQNARQSSLMEAALNYADLGWYVIPLHEPIFNAQGECIGCSCEANYRSESYRRWLEQKHKEGQLRHKEFNPNFSCPEQSRGKHPRISRWEQEASKDHKQIIEWWSRWPTANIGITAGRSGLLDLDLDLYKEAYNGNGLPEEEEKTITNLTGSGGKHLIYLMPEGATYGNETGSLPPGIDVRGYGGLFVAPPSLHRSGNFYAWETGYSPDDMEPLPLPPVIDNALKEIKRGKIFEVTFSENLPMPDLRQWNISNRILNLINNPQKQGFRSEADNSICLSLVYAGASDDQIRAVFEHTPCGMEGKFAEVGEDYLARTIAKARSFAADHPREKVEFKCTDLGNAERMIHQHGDRIRYVALWNKWLIWDGKRWKIDETLEIERLAIETAKTIFYEAASASDPASSKALGSWAYKSQSREKISAMVGLSRSFPEVALHPDQLDSDPWLLNCENGTINLKTGKLQPHDQKDLITKTAPVVYDSQARAPLWQKCLMKWMDEDTEVVDFLARFIGYSATGSIREQCLAFLHGKGSNGKSTFCTTLANLLGDYSQKAPMSMLLQKKGGDGVPNDIARLKGARFVVASEIEEGRKLAETVVKDLTGSDRLTARFMRGEFFEFDPTHKLWMYGNHKPVITGTDNGIWRRILQIPFIVPIPDSDKDEELPEKLRAEFSGILSWIVAGCLLWQEEGLNPPEKVVQATKEYRQEMDMIGRFIEECCDLSVSYSVEYAALFSAYVKWCESSEEHPKKKMEFGNSLTERGFITGKGAGNKTIRTGLRLMTPSIEDAINMER